MLPTWLSTYLPLYMLTYLLIYLHDSLPSFELLHIQKSNLISTEH